MNSKRQVNINGLTIGGNAPVRVESMLKVSLDKRDECLAQCERLIKSGCEMARAALPDAKYADDLRALVASTRLVIMADIHFNPALAILAMEAGCKAIRINPGNMPLSRLNDVISCAASMGVVIRIGANGGSVSQSQLDEANGDRSRALFLAVREQAELLLSHNFTDIILSAKSSSVPECVRANELIAEAYPDFPMHIGLTEAGPGDGGVVKGSACISACGVPAFLCQPSAIILPSLTITAPTIGFGEVRPSAFFAILNASAINFSAVKKIPPQTFFKLYNKKRAAARVFRRAACGLFCASLQQLSCRL